MNNIFQKEIELIRMVDASIKAFREKQDYCNYEGYDFEALHKLADDLKLLEEATADTQDLIWSFREKTR